MSSSSTSAPQAKRPSSRAAAADSPRLGGSVQMSPSSSSGGTNRPAKPLISPNVLFTSILIPFCLLLVQKGLVNVLLVVTCSALLLVNPWVRTFLELPQADEGEDDAQWAEYPGSGASSPQAGSPLLHANRVRGLGAPMPTPSSAGGRRGAHLSRFDPARYLAVSGAKEEKRGGEEEEGRRRVRPRALRATRMSESLRRPLDELTDLAVRDFVRSWYDQQTLRHQSFPRTAHFTIDEIVDSVHGRIVTSGMRSVDLASELVLTTSSVLLSALRSRRRGSRAQGAPTDPASLYRKQYALDPATDPRNPFSGPAAGQSPLWPNTAARIDSLRMAVGALLERHMPREENASRLVMDLVRELLVKHLWSLICSVGEPDFLNRKIVEWGDKQAAETGFGPAASPVAAAPVPVDIDPQLLGQARKEAASTQPEPMPASLAPAPPPAFPANDGTITSQPRGMVMQPSPSPSMTLTTQPRAMAMPSPAPRTSSEAEAHVSSPASSRSPAPPSSRLDSGQPDPRAISPAMPSSGQASPAPSSRPSTGSRSLPRSSVDAPPSRLQQQPQQQLTREPLAALGGLGSFASGAVGTVAGGVGTVAGGVAKGVSKGVDLVGEALDEVGDAIVGNGERAGSSTTTAPAMRGPPTMQSSAIPSSRSYAGGQPSMTPSAMPRSGYRSASAAATPSSSYDHSVPYGGLSPRNKPERRLAQERDDDIDRVMGAGFAVPFDVPSEVHQSVQLPESLRASMRESEREENGAGSTVGQVDSTQAAANNGEPTPTAPEPPRKSLDGYTISEAPQAEAKPVPAPLPASSASVASSTPAGPPLPPRSQPSEPASTAIPSTPVRQKQPSVSSTSGGAPPLAHVLTRTDSDAILSIRDAFEAWLERGGSSSVSTARVAPEEGEALLRVHIGLATIARLVPSDSDETEAFRPDALSILTKARDALEDIDYERFGSDAVVRDGLRQAVGRLEQGPEAGGIRAVVGPVEKQLWSRLLSLYQAFWKERQALKRASQDAKAGGALSYEPRRKQPSQPAAGRATPTRSASSSRPGSSGQSGSQPQPTAGALSTFHNDVGPDSAALDAPGSASSHIEITVTDVSANAERLNANVDPRSLELMIAVEGLAAEGGGFVLMRSWADFEVLDRDLRHAASGPAPSAPLPPLPLPNARRMSSIVLSQALERYLLGILSSPAHVATSAVAHFVDKARAGAASGNRSNALLQSLNRGLNVGAKNFASGVEAMGKTAINTLQRPIAAGAAVGASAVASPQRAKSTSQAAPTTLTSEPASMSSPRGSPEKRSSSRLEPPSERGPPRRSPSEDEVAIEELRAMTAKTRATAERAQSDKSPPPSSELSQRDLDAILSAVFAIADEAFSLSGGWTLRRGMLRVLEQIVRTQYSSSVLSAFNGVAESLSTEQFGKWATETRERWWPNGVFVGAEPGEERTDEMKRRTAVRAREIVLGYAPAQAGYVLGPGGRQACEKAISAVHDEVTDPLTSLDLGLMLTLRLLEIATR